MDDCSIGEKVAFLRRPEAYPAERPARVEVIETHMSWVFLTGRHVYKLKKPVRYAFLDFSTLAARGRDCTAEVRLNRRLAPDTYLGAIPLNRDAAGRLNLDGDGDTVDWLVQMRRLPAERMLDQVIREGRLQEVDLERLGARLAAFYAGCEPVALTAEGYRHRLLETVRGTLEALLESVPEQDRARIERILQAQTALLKEAPALFDARVAQGRIVEGHGDLRPEHVCLTPEPVVFDCLEFNRELRTLDAADELAFLAMECERLGAPEVGRVLFRVYGEHSGDWPEARLLAFYKCGQACVRAKLALWHIFELPRREWEPWRAKAAEYLALADGYIGSGQVPRFSPPAGP
ncbi:hypothetical protein [Thioalkalivibrio sp. ARh3]|uniref:hypothetical protein n=1 Tax=Thioalkalivibrio sp. ARh3 TaxID=1158148 RepID=UPI000366EAD6|nr:hypothetical protein [Thioalkalivibrio sp. ARh3]